MNEKVKNFFDPLGVIHGKGPKAPKLKGNWVDPMKVEGRKNTNPNIYSDPTPAEIERSRKEMGQWEKIDADHVKAV